MDTELADLQSVTPEDIQKAARTYFTRERLSLSLIHISEPTRLGMISYAVFCLKKKNTHLRAHETRGNLVCRLLLEKKKKKKKKYMLCAV